jgi:hypothetical protein
MCCLQKWAQYKACPVKDYCRTKKDFKIANPGSSSFHNGNFFAILQRWLEMGRDAKMWADVGRLKQR